MTSKSLHVEARHWFVTGNACMLKILVCTIWQPCHSVKHKSWPTLCGRNRGVTALLVPRPRFGTSPACGSTAHKLGFASAETLMSAQQGRPRTRLGCSTCATCTG